MKLKIILFASAAALCVGVFIFTHEWRLVPPGTIIDRIVIEKSKREMSIFKDGRQLKTYHVALGGNPIGPKEEEGDMKTPEGVYRIDERKADSDYHLALHLSYPSEADNARAAARGVSAGSDIEIHGLPNDQSLANQLRKRSKDWTAGCIAVSNGEIEELWRVTPVGTTVEIKP